MNKGAQSLGTGLMHTIIVDILKKIIILHLKISRLIVFPGFKVEKTILIFSSISKKIFLLLVTRL